MTEIEQLYNMYFNDVYLYILRLSGDIHVAEDVTGETFLRAIKNIDGFRGDCEVRVWLCQIAKNVYFSYMKKYGKHRNVELSEAAEISDPSSDVADTVAKRDEAARIRKILHGMGEPYKEVFMWRVYADLDFRQIGKMFGKTDNWACVTYHRARKMIRERMEENKGEE